MGGNRGGSFCARWLVHWEVIGCREVEQSAICGYMAKMEDWCKCLLIKNHVCCGIE